MYSRGDADVNGAGESAADRGGFLAIFLAIGFPVTVASAHIALWNSYAPCSGDKHEPDEVAMMWPYFWPIHVAITFPGIIVAPLLPLILLLARVYIGDFYDDSTRDEIQRGNFDPVRTADDDDTIKLCVRPPRFPSQAAADVLWGSTGDRDGRTAWTWHQYMDRTSPLWLLLAFIALLVDYDRNSPPKVVAMFITLLCAVLPVRFPCHTGDNTVYFGLNLLGLHDGLTAVYIIMWAFSGGDLMIWVWCLVAVIAWMIFYALAQLVRSCFRQGPVEVCRGFDPTEALIVGLAYLVYIFVHMGAKRFTAHGFFRDAMILYSDFAGEKFYRTKKLRELYRFCSDGSAEGYHDRVRYVVDKYLFQAFPGFDATEAIDPTMMPPTAAMARDGAQHPPLWDATSTPHQKMYSELWTRCAQPEFCLDDNIDIAGRARLTYTEPWDMIQEDFEYPYSSSFAMRLLLSGPPMLLWGLFPLIVAATSWDTMTPLHIVAVAGMTLLFVASIAMLRPVVRCYKFFLAVAPLQLLYKTTESGSQFSVADWVSQYYAARPQAVVEANVPSDVLPAAVLGEHVAPVMPTNFVELPVAECEALRRGQTWWERHSS
jgi:hypothetical protein